MGVMFYGLLASVLAALFLFVRDGYMLHGFTDPKIIVMTCGMMSAWYWRDGKTRTMSLSIACLVYLACLIPSSVVTRNVGLTLFGFPGIYSCGLLATCLCISGVLIADRLSDEGRETIRRVILSSASAISILCLAQHYGHDPFRWPLMSGGAAGLSGSKVDTGALLVAAFSVSVNPLYLAGIWATKSRGAMLGASVALLPVRFRAWAFVLASAVGMIAASRNPTANDQARMKIWRDTASHASFLGSGPATVPLLISSPNANLGLVTANAHNVVIEAAATRGLPGVLGLLSVLVAPVMAGMWTIAMFNPISFEIVFLACVLVGLGPRKINQVDSGRSCLLSFSGWTTKRMGEE